MATDYRKLCVERFGTDNVEELKKIASKQKQGVKSLWRAKIFKKIIVTQQQGITTQKIAEH